MAIVISVALQKGGAGKTTTAVCLSAFLAQEYNKKVLLIDMDPQANATECFFDLENIIDEPGIGDVLLHRVDINDAILELEDRGDLSYLEQDRYNRLSENLKIIPGKLDMLIDEYRGLYTGISPLQLKTKLEELKDNFDYIICDCPPNLLHFTKNALFASDYVLMPLEPEPLPFRGLHEFIVNILPDLQRQHRTLRPLGVVIVHRAPRVRKYLPEQIRKQIDDLNPNLRFRTEIPLDQELARMAERNLPISVFAPSSSGGLAYYALTAEVVDKISRGVQV